MAPSLEERIVDALRRDGRRDVDAIAAAVDAEPRAVRDRIQAMEADGTIEGYSARLSYDALGLSTVVVRLSVDRSVVTAVTAALRTTREFVTVYETTGAWTVFAVGRFDDYDSLARRLVALYERPDVDGVDVTLVRAVIRTLNAPPADPRDGR